MKTFVENLKELMRKSNLNSADVARAINVPTKTVAEWIGPNARFPQSPEVIRALSNFFSVPVYVLLYGEEDPHSLLGEILEKTEVVTGTYEITVRKVKRKADLIPTEKRPGKEPK